MGEEKNLTWSPLIYGLFIKCTKMHYQFENDHFYGKKNLPGGILKSHSKVGLKAKQKVGGTY